MKTKMQKQSSLLLKLNSLKQNATDFTLMDCTFIIMDDSLSGNGQVVSKEVLQESMDSLLNKPIVAKYYPIVDGGDDHLGTHEEYIGTNRYGEQVLTSDTETIGHFTSGGYIEEVDGVAVLMCNGVLHKEKHPDVVDLLLEWQENGIHINSSVEYYYSNYEMLDGIEHIKSPIIYSQFCLLNSEERGGYDEVKGAYSSATVNLSANMKQSWNNALDSNKNNKNKECGLRMEKIINELSIGKLASKVYEVFYKTMTAEEFNKIYISNYNIYPDHFVYEYWNGENYEYYDVKYIINESDEIEADLENKIEVERQVDWVAVKNELDTKIETLEKSLNEKDTEITSLNNNQIELEKQLNEKITEIETINEQLKSLNAIAEEVAKKEFKEKLANALEEYKVKFTSVNAIERFESEEIQTMIKESINDEEKVIALNSIIVALLPKVTSSNSENKTIPQLPTKDLNNLIPEKTETIDSKYFN